jgi:hypothetical protein
MLKIKDNVDLKELEKFGFKYRERWYDNGPESEDNSSFYELDLDLDDNRSYAVVCCYTREIFIPTSLYGVLPTRCLENMDWLYDLIQAGFVEKVK